MVLQPIHVRELPSDQNLASLDVGVCQFISSFYSFQLILAEFPGELQRFVENQGIAKFKFKYIYN